MKKLILFLMLLSISVATFSQAKDETVVINVKDLTSQQLAKIKADQEQEAMIDKIEGYSKAAGWGKEIGIAIRDALSAVVDVSQKFGDTKIGKYTIMIVAWKFLGQDIIRIIIGLIFIFVMSIIFFKIFRNLFPRKFIVKGSRLVFWLPREYELYDPMREGEYSVEGLIFTKIIMLSLYTGSFGVGYAIMFG